MLVVEEEEEETDVSSVSMAFFLGSGVAEEVQVDLLLGKLIR